ncbi:MAG: putative pseudouridine synthase aq [Candidatus Doudnabacteria bacterium]|nr:putative pseudouridine synthase aq [Candidatus Doudnabacteria bacterium]
MQTFVVEKDQERLDRFLADSFKNVSRSRIQKDIEAGKVMVNGETVLEGKVAVRVNDKVEYNYTAEEAISGKDVEIKVIYESADILIIDKPAGLVVHPAPGYKGPTLAEGLLYKYKDINLVGEDEIRPGIVHRLDKDTSGVMLVAKTQKMFEYLKDAFLERKVKKQYIALVTGHIPSPHGFISNPIGKHPTDFRKMTAIEPIDPKASSTEYTVLEYLQPQTPTRVVDEYTLVRVNLHTGRTHQIRVHFSSKNSFEDSGKGFPIVGDNLYGPKAAKSSLPGLHRQFLHASQIEVQLPDGTWIEAHSPLPEDLKTVLENLNSKNTNL